jgi:NAD(P)-dependent dehydrogenase (short-subunit alcohol dehydrogenase family)
MLLMSPSARRRSGRLLIPLLFGVSTPILAQSAGQPERAVLVTGASTGIGRKMAEVLASRGFFVYAGARKDKDLADLATIKNVQPVKLDVTSKDDIAAAVATVEKGGRGLYAVINNAGVAVLGPLIETDDADLNFVFDVNVLGPHRVTRAFSKLLIASKGRVVTTGSISGILAGPLFGVYAMSKHAVEAYTDALSSEMARVGVKVSVIEPGDYRSEMGKNVLRQMQERGQKIEGSLYEKELRAVIPAATDQSRDPDPDDVADAAFHALSDPNPKLRYLVVPTQAQATSTLRKQMLQLVQLNQDHKYTLSRDSLVALLDQALARIK